MTYDQLPERVKNSDNTINEYIRKLGSKTYIPFVAKVDEISFKNTKYTEFSRRIGIELISIESCEIDTVTGKVIIFGDMDSELSMSTFEIGYPIGQPALITDNKE